MGLQRTPMYASLTRPSLFGGCEKWPLSALVLGALALPFLLTSYGFNFSLFCLTALLAVIGIAVLRRVNKLDPQWTAVYWRSLLYKPFILAKAHLRANRAHSWTTF